MEHSESSPKRDTHSMIGLPQETRKISINNHTLFFQEREIEEQQQQSPKQAEEKNNKDQSRNKQNRI